MRRHKRIFAGRRLKPDKYRAPLLLGPAGEEEERLFMEKPVYYSKKYTQQMTAISKEQIQQVKAAQAAVAAVPAAPPVRTGGRRSSKAGPFILVACLAVAILSVMLVPMLLGGGDPVKASTSGPVVESTVYANVEAGLTAAGVESAVLPALPEGFVFAQCRVAGSSMLEVDITGAKNPITLRVAAGNEDLSGVSFDEFSFSTTEEVGSITRGYAGVSNKKLNAAVWISGDYSYALLSDSGVDAEVMRQLAESVA